MKKILSLGVILGLGLAVLPQVNEVEAKTQYIKYQNCKLLNKKYKGGVAKDTRSSKVSSNRYKAYVNKKLYTLNKSKDRDNDGVACER